MMTKGRKQVMEFRDRFYIIMIIAVNIVASYSAFVLSPTEKTMGDLIRIFYVHTPAAWVCYLSLGISLVGSIAFLAKRKPQYDRIAEASAVLGLVYGAIALVTGSIWANATWGAYWNWDPRETTTLILWIAYMGYLSLKLSIGQSEKKATIGAVYNVLAFSTLPLSYLSIQLWHSLHPQVITATQIAITTPMIETLVMNLLASSLVFAYILREMITLRGLEARARGGVSGGS